jgi:hypothetical protein
VLASSVASSVDAQALAHPRQIQEPRPLCLGRGITGILASIVYTKASISQANSTSVLGTMNGHHKWPRTALRRDCRVCGNATSTSTVGDGVIVSSRMVSGEPGPAEIARWKRPCGVPCDVITVRRWATARKKSMKWDWRSQLYGAGWCDDRPAERDPAHGAPTRLLRQVNLPRTAAALAFVGFAGTVAAVTDHATPRGAASAAVLCGGANRWDVKTLSDLRGPNAPKLKRNAERRTIHYLVTQEHEAIGKHTARLAGVRADQVRAHERGARRGEG